MVGITFWESKFEGNKNCLTHSKGLNKEQIELLHSLQEGDKLIMYYNGDDRPSDSYPLWTIRIHRRANKHDR